MGWILNHQPLKQAEQLDAFFLAVGKALCLACAFEAKCKHILNLIKLSEHCKNGGHLSDSAALSVLLRSQLLGPTIKEVSGFPDFSSEGIVMLECAKDARNFIAHESALLAWPISDTRADTISEKVTRLRSEVETLVTGDNLVSRWIYEFEEKEPAHPIIYGDYFRRIEQWIFGEIDSGSVTEAPEDNRTRGEKLDALCSIPVSPKRAPQ
jgi:hypothetical protein